MQDPVVGGLGKEKIALRRAMAMSYDVAEEIKVIRNGQAVEAHYPIPPGVVGHEPNYKSSVKYDPAGANALLDRFGYKKGADGYRTLPDGKPFTIRCEGGSVVEREHSGCGKKSMNAIGINWNSMWRLLART
jgi:ABC-type transport system substrate-binding protein